MENKMTGEQCLCFMAGQITALKYAWSALIATHPLKGEIIKLIKGIPNALTEVPVGIEGTSLESYK